jgi:hypothetical protein
MSSLNIFATVTKARISFARDILPLYREFDKTSMMQTSGRDLTNYEDTKAGASQIYYKLESGQMPCDMPWEPPQVALFKQWMDDGMAP